jgi:transcriptional regulator with XRE-family HTH domain
MKPKDFKRWRKNLGLSQKTAAEALGLKRRVVQYYEKGERDGKDVGIPKAVRLACYALTEGVSDYHGPRDSERPSEPASRVLINGAGHEGEHHESPSAELLTLRPEDANGEANGKKPGKGKKEKSKDKNREKSKGKDRGKGESTAASRENH